MKTKDEFKKIISKSFWDHIRKYSLIPVEEAIERDKFCDQLYEELCARTYHPSLPREYVIADRHNGSTRLIPVFTVKDNCVYYFCVKSLEDYLAEGYVDCTFGGFRLSGKVKEREEDLFNEINAVPFSISPFSYNRTAWVEAWGDFQSKAFKISREGSLGYFIIFDIANFYSSINLSLLENRIRNCADKSLSDEIDLLFYFLRYWDRKLSFYSPKTVGIPMDDFGDGSRLLANFFLQSYDKKVFSFCQENSSKYLRYSDDQIILAPDRETAIKILRFASLELSRVGLNINSGKIKHLENRVDFEKYWAFEIFEKLQDKNDTGKIGEAVKEYFLQDKSKIKWFSIFKKIINCNIAALPIDLKSKIFSEIFDENFITSCDHRYLVRLYKILESDEDKKRYMEFLKDIAQRYLYTRFHYYLLLAKMNGLPVDFEGEIIDRIDKLKFII